jgi:hypothetical protein
LNNQTLEQLNFKPQIMKLKINTTQLLSYFILLYILFLLPTLLHAQPGFGDDVEDVPVDGGLSLLVAAGVGYGAKRLKNRKKS